ncbi:hypothetical protein JVU11DRAFT_7731 [Chiua virens]|nr:hypothetical protein JVU11DRAFT_7731 [Chiua virens]
MDSLLANSKTVLVAIMGATGVGMFIFIKLLTNDDKIRIGHNQQSETVDIQAAHYVDGTTGRPVVLLDTPGFDDSREGVTDSNILQQIVDWLEPKTGQWRKLNGIIYMHRISDSRVGGVSRKNIRMFRSLCGDDRLGNVRIATTNWSRVSEAEGSYREADLKREAFKVLLDSGAQMCRHANTAESARKIVSELIPLQAVTMQIQKELHDGKKLSETTAAAELENETREMKKKNGRELEGLRKEMKSAGQARDRTLRVQREQERKSQEARVARVEADRKRVEKTIQERRQGHEKKMKDERAKLARLTELQTKQRREMQAQLTAAKDSETKSRQQATQKQRNLERELAEVKKRIKQLRI